MTRPTLYVPDYVGYAEPFMSVFDLRTDNTQRYSKKLLDESDYLLLTGGEDIHPSYYSQPSCSATRAFAQNPRDRLEHELASHAVVTGKPIIGICRGAQWLSILAGGALIQHTTGHGGGQHALITDTPTFEGPLYMTSIHHQMCDLRGVEHDLIAWTERLSKVYLNGNNINMFPNGLEKEPEVFYIPSIRGYGIQGHPEAMYEGHPTNLFLRASIRATFNL